MSLFIRDDLQRVWKGKEIFSHVQTIQGTVYRDLDGRRTLRFEESGRGYFLKLHTGVGWGEILKNLISFRLPVTGAENEWKAIEKLQALGVETLKIAACGSEGGNPARRVSFLITDELVGLRSLEEVCADWPKRPPPPAFKRLLIDRIATVSRILHGHGLNHRDYYLCHFLSNIPEDGPLPDAENLKVVLIDLHRVQHRARTPERWIVKDLGGLFFSAMDIGLTRRDAFRFIRTYAGKPLGKALVEDAAFWRKVNARARAFYRKYHGRDSRFPL